MGNFCCKDKYLVIYFKTLPHSRTFPDDSIAWAFVKSLKDLC